MFTRKPGFGLLSMARAWRLMAAILHSNQLAVSIPISYIYKMFYAHNSHTIWTNERKLCVRIENEKMFVRWSWFCFMESRGALQVRAGSLTLLYINITKISYHQKVPITNIYNTKRKLENSNWGDEEHFHMSFIMLMDLYVDGKLFFPSYSDIRL